MSARVIDLNRRFSTAELFRLMNAITAEGGAGGGAVPRGEQSGARGMRCHPGAGETAPGERANAVMGEQKIIPTKPEYIPRKVQEPSPCDTEQDAPPGAKPITTCAGCIPPRTREGVPEGTHQQEALLTRQEQSHSPGERAQALQNAQRITILPLRMAHGEAKGSPEEEHIEEDTRTPKKMDGCPEPRTAKRRKESEDDKGQWRRSPRGWMGAGAKATLEDQTQASSVQAQSDRRLEDSRCLVSFLMTWF